jgi:hypothetical protein
MQPVTTSLENCQVRISWETPAENGSPIDNYILEVKNIDGDFKVIAQADCPHLVTETSCLIDLEVFSEAPFYLNHYGNHPGDMIIPRMSANSDAGQSRYSNLKETDQFIAGPQTIERPVFISTDSDIEICWNDVLASYDMSMDPKYEIYWNESPAAPGSVFTFKDVSLGTCY